MGVTIGVMAISLVLASFPLGILADRYGRRGMLILGNVTASLSLIGFALTANLALVLLFAAVEGIGEAAFAVSSSALLADKAGDQKRTLAFSLIAFLGWIAGAIGGFAVSSVIALQTLGLNIAQAHIALYLIVGLLGLSVTPLILKIQETPRYSGQTRLERRGVLPRKSAKVLIRFSTYSVMIAVGAGLFVPLMAIWIGMGLLALPFYVATVLYVSAIISFWFLFKGTRLPEESREITQPLAPSIQEETTATL